MFYWIDANSNEIVIRINEEEKRFKIDGSQDELLRREYGHDSYRPRRLVKLYILNSLRFRKPSVQAISVPTL